MTNPIGRFFKALVEDPETSAPPQAAPGTPAATDATASIPPQQVIALGITPGVLQDARVLGARLPGGPTQALNIAATLGFQVLSTIARSPQCLEVVNAFIAHFEQQARELAQADSGKEN